MISALIYVALVLKKRIDQEIIVKEKFLTFTLPIDENNLNILHELIESSINSYKVYNFEITDEQYVTEEMQTKMIKYVLQEVLESISPVYMSKLELIYSKNKIQDICYSFIRDHVLAISIEINGNYHNK